MLIDNIQKIMKDFNRPMSAVEITEELQKRGELPELHTVIDIADYMKEWFSPA